MPSPYELLVLVLAIFVLWIILKVARFALRVIMLVISLAVLAGVLWLLFAR